MKIFVALLVSMLAALSCLYGCSTIGNAIVEKPKVDLDHVGVKNADSTGAVILFGLKVNNPNSFALKVDSLKYDVEIGGKQFSSGKIENAAEVKAKETSVVEIPVPVKYSDVFSSLLDLVSNKKSTYRLKGEAAFGLLNIPFDEKGEFKLHE